MSHQFVINIENKSIIPTIKKMLSLIQGVSILPIKKEDKLSFADQVSPSGDKWWNNTDNVAIVKKGIEEAKQGQCVELSDEELNKMLGL